MEVIGNAYALHKAWRVAQTIISICSAVATRTRNFIEIIEKYSNNTVFATSRKTPPGLRPLYIKSVIAGGGAPHRLGLYDSILIFSNHKHLLKDISLKKAIKNSRKIFPEKIITVEAKNLSEAIEALDSGADAIQLDKLSPEDIRHLKEIIRKRRLAVKIIVTGNITIESIDRYASLKPDIILSSDPYYGKPIDITTIIEPIKL